MRPRQLARLLGGLSLLVTPNLAEAEPSLPGAETEGASSLPESAFPWQINDVDPEGSLPSEDELLRDPISAGNYLMALIDRAERALQANELDRAERYFGALGRLIPDRSRAFGKLCEVYEKKGDRLRAMTSCRAAVSLPGAQMVDFVRHVQVLLSKEDSLTKEELDEAKDAIAHLQKEAPEEMQGYALECTLGLRTRDREVLARCVPKLRSLAPEAPSTLMFAWVNAILQEDLAEAERFFAEAKGKRLPEKELQLMEREMEAARTASAVPIAGVALVATLAIAGAAAFRAYTRRRAGRRESGESNAAEDSE